MAGDQLDRDFAFDPLDMSRVKDPQFMGRIRRERPVCRPAEGIVLTTRYHDTAGVFRDTQRFSSVGDMRAPGVVVPEEERFLGEIDAPVHPRIRRLLFRHFTHQRARRAEQWTRQHVRGRLQAFCARGGGDLMRGLAVPTPVSLAAHIVGLSDDLHDPIVAWCDELLHSTWPALGKTERGEGIAGAFPDFAEMLDGQICERQARASEDLLSLMVRTRDDDGWQIPPQHVRTLSINMMSGALSASYMLGNLLYRFLSDDSFAQALRSDPSRIPAAIEESLRFESPVVFLFRTAREDTQIGGRPVRKGEHVMLGIAAANRDETMYEHADEFRLDRVDPTEHLAFGIGPHVCLGSQLSRMAGRVVLEEVIDRFAPGQIRLTDDYQWQCVEAVHEYGPETLDVVLTLES